VKLAYVGNFDPEFSTENDVRKAFEHLGHEVLQLQENRASRLQVREAAFNSDLLLITGTWDEAQPLRETLDTLRECAMRGIPTATLHLDIFFGSDRGAREMVVVADVLHALCVYRGWWSSGRMGSALR
jgi:hypothetical protein